MSQLTMHTNSWIVCPWKLTPLTAGFTIPDRFKWRNKTAQFTSNELNRNRHRIPFRTEDMWSLWIEGEGFYEVEWIDFFLFFFETLCICSTQLPMIPYLHILRMHASYRTPIQIVLSGGFFPRHMSSSNDHLFWPPAFVALGSLTLRTVKTRIREDMQMYVALRTCFMVSGKSMNSAQG